MSWTDDLPVCERSDVGVSYNVRYIKNEVHREPIPYMDYAFNLRTEDNCSLYAIFDGHDGTRASHFAADRLPAELLLGQLNPKVSDASIKNVLYDAFRIVERCYFESLDNELAKRAFHQSKVADSGLPAEVAAKRYADSFKIIENLDKKIKGGTTAVIALLLNKKLFVANVGNSRCLLCKMKPNGMVECQQLSKDHDIHQTEEISRLRQIGVDTNTVISRGKIGNSACTRSIGDYSVKGGYRDIEYLRPAIREPVTAEPDILGGKTINEDGIFLVLMSDGVYESLQESTNTSNPNCDVAKLVSHEMMSRPSIQGVAQRVVDKIAHKHKQVFGQKVGYTRGDMTLVVRNFSHLIGKGPLIDIDPDVQPVSVPFTGSQEPETLSLVMPPLTQHKLTLPGSGGSRSSLHYTSASTSPSDDTPTNVTPINTKPKVSERLHSDVFTSEQTHDEDTFYRSDHQDSKKVEKDGRVQSYIKLDQFNAAWQKFIANNPGQGNSLL